MYSEQDLQTAIAAGAITEEAAQALRDHVAATRATPFVDEENFRLISGFNDIFVAIAAIILLVAVWWIGSALQSDVKDYTSALPGVFGEGTKFGDYQDRAKGMGGLLCALAAWLLAEYFTRKRRMAFPSIILLGAFVIGIASALNGFYLDWDYTKYGYAQSWQNTALAPLAEARSQRLMLVYSAIGLFTAVAAYAHWRRFHVPIAVAALAAAVGAVILFGLFYLFDVQTYNSTAALTPILILGVAIFAFAMWWDMSDKKRETGRSDVAFWLHLLAAPLIAHPLFALIGVTQGDSIGIGAIIGVLAVYLGFCLVALAVDRRALLVSALAYVLIALTALFRQYGVVELNVAVTALIIGSALLLLSAFWTTLRRMIVSNLPRELQGKLPAI